MTIQEQLDSLRRRAGDSYERGLRVTPETLDDYAWALGALSDSARQLPTGNAPDALAAALPMSDTGRACTAATQAFNASARGIAERLSEMAAIARSVAETYDSTDEAFATKVLRLEDLR